jgi:hypothetical protein
MARTSSRAANIVVSPHRFELGTQPTEFVDERLDRGPPGTTTEPSASSRETQDLFNLTLLSR